MIHEIKRTKLSWLASASLAGVVALTGVSAQAAEQSVGLEEIVVTARRQEENLMTVPLAITAITAADIQNQGIKQFQDISAFAPSFHFQPQTGGGSGRNDRSSRALTFRGLSVAGGIMFIDGLPVGGSNPPPIFEVERVEVLTGPQAAYFGRSTFMGAINFVTKNPAREPQATVVAEYSSFGSNEILGSVEGPIFGEKLRGRLSLTHRYQGGQYENAGDHQEKLGQQQTDSATLNLIFEPSSNLTVKAWLNYFVDNDGPPAQAAFKQPEFNCSLGGTRGRYYCGTLPDRSAISDNIISSNYEITPYIYNQLFNNPLGFVTVFDPHWFTEGGLKREGYQAHLRSDFQFGGGFTLSTLTAYHKDKQQIVLDLLFRDGRNTPNTRFPAQGAPYITWLLMSQGISWDFSQEVRITSPQDKRLRGTIGANYLRQDSVGTLYGVKYTGTASSGTPGHSHPNTPAVFGGAYFDINDKLTLSAEGRYQWDNIKNDQVGFSTGFPRPTPLLFSATFKSFSPRVILDYKFAPNSTAYALFSRGYRPGGFNTSLAGQPASVLAQFVTIGLNETFDQEKVDNYEVGLKSTFWGGRGRATVALYYDKWLNGQISTSVPFTTQLGQTNLLSITQNLGQVNLKGIEFEGEIKPLANLTLSASFGLNDTEIKVFTCGDCTAIYGNTNAVGNVLPQAEKYKFTLGAQYEGRVTETMSWFARGDYLYRGSYFTDASNVLKVQPTHTVNLRAGLRHDDWSAELFVRNLLQEDALTGFPGVDVFFSNAATNDIRIALPDRRMFGMRVSHNF